MGSNAISPICQLFRIHDGLGPPASPLWTDDQVNQIVRHLVSPMLYVNIRELFKPEAAWDFWLRDLDGCDLGTAVMVLNGLRVDVVPGPTTRPIPELLMECHALWIFRIIPERYPGCRMWRPGDAHGRIIALPSGPSQENAWCWNVPASQWDCCTSLQLAIIAFVLGWDDSFKRQLKPVIWDWPPDFHDHVVTPIPCLYPEGPDGLFERRKRERKLLFKEMWTFLQGERQANGPHVDWVVRELGKQSIWLDQPDNHELPSIYETLRKIEATLTRPRRASSARSDVVRRRRPNNFGRVLAFRESSKDF